MYSSCNVLPKWPKLSLDAEHAPVDGPARAPRTPHSWRSLSGLWRYYQCSLGKRSEEEVSPSGCSARPKLDDTVLKALRRKVNAFHCSDGSVLFICLRCKYHCTGGRIKGVCEKCNGSPAVTAGQSWKNLCAWMRPNPLRSHVSVAVGDVLELLSVFHGS